MPTNPQSTTSTSIRLAQPVQSAPQHNLPKLPFGLQAVRDPMNGQVRVVTVTAVKKHTRKRG